MKYKFSRSWRWLKFAFQTKNEKYRRFALRRVYKTWTM